MMRRWLLIRVVILATFPVLVWGYWISLRGLIWGSAFCFIFFSGGLWWARVYHSKEWPR